MKYLFLCLAFIIACGPSARQVQLKTAYVGLSAAADGLVAYSSAKQDDIVAKATSLEEGMKQLTAFKVTRDKVANGISAAFHALAAASILDAGLANALSATAQALAAWEDLKGLK